MKTTMLLALLAVLAAGAAGAGEQTPRQIDLPAGTLTRALEELTDQAGVQIMYEPKITDGLKVAALKGRLTFQAALAQLLANTGLKADNVDSETVVVKRIRPGAMNAGPAGQMQVAVLAQGGKAAQAVTGPDNETAQVVVEAQRDRPAPFSTANLDLTRTEDDALPFQVFDARDIELSGASNLQEFLQTRLPQSFTPDILEELDGSAQGNDFQNNAGTVDLRGWGAVETVFLLNGRRMPAHYQRARGDTSNATPDLRGIALGSIERIEILSSAGSAIYGVGATGGVINIITREDFRGGQVAVNYETPSDTHAPRRSVDLGYGLPLPWGLGLRLGASYSDSEPLRAGDRADVSIERWRRRVMELEPERLINRVSGDPFRTSSAVYGATPNIRATATSGNLFSGLPGAQPSNYTTVPAGATGSSPLSAYQPGTHNVELAAGADGGTLYARDSTLGSRNTSRGLTLGIDKTLGGEWRWSLDARYTATESEGSVLGALSFTSSSSVDNRPRVPAAAPGNPFNQPVSVRLVDPNLDRPELRNRPRNATVDLSSTLRGAVGQWRGFFDLRYSHNRNRYFSNTFYEPHGGWTAAFLSGAYNPFVDPRVTSPAAPAFYEQYVLARSDYASATRTFQSALKASGPLLSLPAGSVQLTAGLEASRTDRYRMEFFSQYEDALTGQPMAPVGGAEPSPLSGNPNLRFVSDSYAAYAEATLPLLSPAQGVPLVQRLELFGSGRLDRVVRDAFRSQGLADQEAGVPPVPVKYTTSSHLHAVGLRYEPMEGVTLRATRSIGFKPPSIAQTTPAATPPTSTVSGLNDPLRPDWNGVLTPAMYVSGGNPDVRPETSRSTNLGFIFMSRGAPGLRVSVDYLESVRDDAIFTLSPQDAINLESEVPGVVRRATPQAGGVGSIVFVDIRTTNLRRILSKSVDFSLEQRVDNVLGGRLVFSAAATRNLSFKVQATNTGPAVEQVRNPVYAFSRQIAWNGNAQARWEGSRWSVGWSTRYFDYILVPGPVNDPAQLFLLQGADRAPRAFNHDLNVNYRAPSMHNPRGVQAVLSGTSISFGVKNLFDRTPRFWAAGTDYGVAPYDSIAGRSVWMQMRRDFGR